MGAVGAIGSVYTARAKQKKKRRDELRRSAAASSPVLARAYEMPIGVPTAASTSSAHIVSGVVVTSAVGPAALPAYSDVVTGRALWHEEAPVFVCVPAKYVA